MFYFLFCFRYPCIRAKPQKLARGPFAFLLTPVLTWGLQALGTCNWGPCPPGKYSRPLCAPALGMTVVTCMTFSLGIQSLNHPPPIFQAPSTPVSWKCASNFQGCSLHVSERQAVNEGGIRNYLMRREPRIQINKSGCFLRGHNGHN